MIVSPNRHLKIPKNCKSVTRNASAIFSISLKEYYDQIGLLTSIHESTIAFKKSDISLADSIQRYNFIWQLNMSPKDALKKANQLGDKWIDYYLPLIPGREPKIIKWDYWLNHSDFKNQKNFIQSQYEKDNFFKKNIELSALEYINRYSLKNKISDLKIALNLSIELIKEEITVLALQARLGYEFEIFFEARNIGLKYFYEKILWIESKSILQPIIAKIKF